MFFHIKVSAKDKQTLESFNQFMKELKIISGFLDFSSKYNKRQFVTVLKSPHVNKTAQEQFEFRFYTKEFIVSSFKPLTFFLTLKKLNHLSLFGVDLQIKSLFKKNKRKKLSALNPDSVRLEISKNDRNSHNNKKFDASKRYVQLFDCYGEISLKYNLHLNAHVSKR